MFYEVLMEKRAARTSGIEKVAIDPLSILGAVIPTSTIKHNAERVYIPQSPLFLGAKTPWLAAKFQNRGRQLRQGVANAGERSGVQTLMEDFMMAPEASHMNKGVALVQDAATRAKIKMNPFMHKPEDIDRLNRDLKSGKSNMYALRDRIKALRAQGQEGTPEYRELIANRRDAAGVFKRNLKELRQEQQLGDLPMTSVMDKLQAAGLQKARKEGMGEERAHLSAMMGRAMINEHLEEAGIDPSKTNLRQVQDRLHRWANDTRADRHAKADAKRSGFGKAIAGTMRKLYDPGMGSGETSSRLLGQIQLDDVYDPLAKMRTSAESVSGAATSGLATAGRLGHAPAEALEKRYGKQAKEYLVKAREGVLEWDPVESAKKLVGADAPPPVLPPPVLPTKRVSGSKRLRYKKRRQTR